MLSLPYYPTSDHESELELTELTACCHQVILCSEEYLKLYNEAKTRTEMQCAFVSDPVE